ncbi:hypothetical protein EUX98_g4616 [Antrodiella citrinella]|uniref:Glycoside hydrolase family 92 protein n=1 Tax=Antrodiella citrinella TaxID=2447956 RepID=A0A4V3XIK7_9APHY|nr:hypothetical protein EUX98_g4616 [Antrodiella citrinella]
MHSILVLCQILGLVSLSRQANVPSAFTQPASNAVDHIDPMIGNGGDSPNGSGGMIPSTAPPFAMTRWVAQTRQNYVSVTPYNITDTSIHGFQGTHQPAIWMGESGQVVIVPGGGEVQGVFEKRGMSFSHDDEVVTASYYSVKMDVNGGGSIHAEQSASSRVGHLRFSFDNVTSPYVLLEATRASVMGSDDPQNVTYPVGDIEILPVTREITGRNPERQDFIIGPNPAPNFAGYFVARFSEPFASFGIITGDTDEAGHLFASGRNLSGYAKFDKNVKQVDVRVGVSFISVEQARWNLDNEIPDGTALEQTAKNTRTAWAEKLDRIQIEVCSTLMSKTRTVITTLDMMTQCIKVSTHADSLIAEAVLKGVTGFDYELAYEAVHKDATVPPKDDWTISYFDREENVGYEVRAGLSSVYRTNGWVASDIHSEAASRTLDYAYDDHAVGTLASLLNKSADAEFFLARSVSAPFTIFNNDTGFMEARNANGSWAGQDAGWTEGDMWAYTFDVVQDLEGLIEHKGGNASFVQFLDEHFDGGHNDQTNEPSHHIPYLYSLAGAASKTQERVREVSQINYNASINGLSGNEDCGQMSAWYIFSALGFYPVNPLSGEYVVGTPFFDKVTIDLPGVSNPLIISSDGAGTNPYVSSLQVNGRSVQVPVITHNEIAKGGDINFVMNNTPQTWASQTLVDTDAANSIASARSQQDLRRDEL